MSELVQDVYEVPEIDSTDPEVIRDPVVTYRKAREQAPLARLLIPGFGSMWVITRHAPGRAMLADPRFELSAASFLRPPGIPEECLRYLRTMGELNGAEHLRQRRLATPAFTPRSAEHLRPRMAAIAAALLDDLPAHVEDGSVDLLTRFAQPLPIEVICELMGIPDADRPRWRTTGAAIAAGNAAHFFAAIPGILADAQAALARRSDAPADDLLSDLIRLRAEHGDRLSEVELITLIWHLVLAGQTPTNLITNAVLALLTHPDQLAALRADPSLMACAVEELIRWCSPQLLTVPRHPSEDVEIDGIRIPAGEPVVVSIIAANHDPRVFTDPDRLDIRRATTGLTHLGFAHGPHFCLGASLARVQVEVALNALLARFPALTLATPAEELRYASDAGTWRLAALPVRLSRGFQDTSDRRWASKS